MVASVMILITIFTIEGLSLAKLRMEEKSEHKKIVKNVIGDAYLYGFVEEDYDYVEEELLRFADELALAV